MSSGKRLRHKQCCSDDKQCVSAVTGSIFTYSSGTVLIALTTHCCSLSRLPKVDGGGGSTAWSHHRWCLMHNLSSRTPGKGATPPPPPPPPPGGEGPLGSRGRRAAWRCRGCPHVGVAARATAATPKYERCFSPSNTQARHRRSSG